MSKWSECAHIRCVTCVRALWLTLDGGRVWSVVLTQLRGIFLLEDTHCHRSCHFWTVYSRIMMTSFKQAGLLKRSHHYPRVDSSEMNKRWQCASSTRKYHEVASAPRFRHALRQALTPTPVWMQREPERAHTHVTHRIVCALRSLGHGCVQEVKNYINTVRFSHKPLVSCLRPSMCSYDRECLIWISLCMSFFPLIETVTYTCHYMDWQTRTVWPKNIKIGSTEEKRHLHLGCPWVSW